MILHYLSSIRKSILFLFLFIVCFLGISQFSLSYGEEQSTANIPWSGYWWQFNECGLATGKDYYDHPSPLEKYELYSKGYYPGELTNWYKTQYCSQDQLSWAGHCGHWALAATWENYEILPSSIDNIIFRVGDKKGLLTLMHNDDSAIWGNGEQPNQFHLWLLKYIKDEKRAFIADLSTGEEVWQYPIYKYNMTSVSSGNTESVTVEIFYADDFVHPDYIGTQPKSTVYTYDLFLNSQNEIIGGEWTGNSVADHPERMYYTISPGTTAPAIDYGLVMQIAKSKDDFIENGSVPVAIDLGTYNLILLDPDVYTLDMEENSTILIDLELLDGGGDDFTAVITDKRSVIVGEYTVTRDSQASIKIISEFPPYTIRIYKNDYSTPGIYSLKYDAFRPFSTTISYVPKDGNWSGFAITNFDEDVLDDVCLTTYTKEGKALHTIMGPISTTSGEKNVYLFSNLSYRKNEFSQIDAVRISAPKPIGAINLFGTSDGVATISQGWYKGTHLVLPDTITEMQINRRMFARIINESDSISDVELILYNAAGLSLKTVEITLDPRQSYYIRPGTAPFSSVPDSGWIEILCKTDGNELSGFQYIEKNNTLEVNFAIPVTDNNKIVPHIPVEGKWETQLVLINNGSVKADFVLHRVMAGNDTSGDVSIEVEPKARISIELQDYFGTSAADPYYRSILSVASSQAFSGYYMYHSLDYEENVTIPLLETGDHSSSLVLSHNTQGTAWWTAVGIVNPSAQKVDVVLKPYGEQGELLTDLTRTHTLDSGEYNVFSMAGEFGDRVSEIAYLKFESQSPSHNIGGFFMYGNQEQGICGASLQVISD